MKLLTKQLNEEVLFTLDPITKVNKDDVQCLKAKALRNKRKRVRLCAHLSETDKVHEMFIVHTKNTYVRPHRHPGKSESFHLLEGELDIVVFDDAGEVTNVITMGDYSSGETFFWRLSESYFHTVIPRSEIIVVHETTSGPFVRSTSFVPAVWSPEESDSASVERYTKRLFELVDLKKINR